MIVIASIHQPSTSTLLLFDDLLLLSKGQSLYYGPPDSSPRYFESLGFLSPPMVSLAEFMLDLANTDFRRESQQISRLSSLSHRWSQSFEKRNLDSRIEATKNKDRPGGRYAMKQNGSGFARSLPMQSLILLHRMALV